jgi:hypothetical protein
VSIREFLFRGISLCGMAFLVLLSGCQTGIKDKKPVPVAAESAEAAPACDGLQFCSLTDAPEAPTSRLR